MSLFTSTAELGRELQRKYNVCDKWLQKVQRTPDDISSIMRVHKEMWSDGVRHDNFGYDQYGMFRSPIDTLSMSSLYLGDVEGIWRNPAQEFEKPKFKYVDGVEPEYGKKGQLTDDYIKICRQYRNHLAANLRAMKSNVYDHGYNRDRIERNVVEGFSKVRSGQSLGDFRILNESVADNKVLDVSFTCRGRSVLSTMVNVNGEFFLPEGFESGVKMNPSRISEYELVSLYHLANGNECYRKLDRQDVGTKITEDKQLEPTRSNTKSNVRHIAEYSKSKGVKFGI